MNEENTESTSETQETSTEVETQSLEDIIPEFNIQPQTETGQTNTQQQTSYAQARSVSAPDPVTDPDGFKDFVANQNTEVNSLRDELRQVTGQLKDFATKAQERAEEKEIQSISTEMASKIGEGTDPELVEVALGLRYRKDENFKKIWDNRGNNAKAFKKAMGIVTNDLKGKFARTVDPQVAENVRAMNQSINKASNSPKPDTPIEDKFRGGNFDQEWARLINQG